MENFFSSVLMGMLRTALAGVGGYLLKHGVDAASANGIVSGLGSLGGAAITLGGAALGSYINKSNTAKTVASIASAALVDAEGNYIPRTSANSK